MKVILKYFPFLLVFALFSCEPEPEPESIRGRVMIDCNTPYANQTIELWSEGTSGNIFVSGSSESMIQSIQTNAGGGFFIELDEIHSNWQSIRVNGRRIAFGLFFDYGDGEEAPDHFDLGDLFLEGEYPPIVLEAKYLGDFEHPEPHTFKLYDDFLYPSGEPIYEVTYQSIPQAGFKDTLYNVPTQIQYFDVIEQYHSHRSTLLEVSVYRGDFLAEEAYAEYHKGHCNGDWIYIDLGLGNP